VDDRSEGQGPVLRFPRSESGTLLRQSRGRAGRGAEAAKGR